MVEWLPHLSVWPRGVMLWHPKYTSSKVKTYPTKSNFLKSMNKVFNYCLLKYDILMRYVRKYAQAQQRIFIISCHEAIRKWMCKSVQCVPILTLLLPQRTNTDSCQDWTLQPFTKVSFAQSSEILWCLVKEETLEYPQVWKFSENTSKYSYCEAFSDCILLWCGGDALCLSQAFNSFRGGGGSVSYFLLLPILSP